MEVDEKGEQEEEIPTPEDIILDSVVFDIQFHPTRELIACGLVSGVVHLYQYGAEANVPLFRWDNLHKKSCRALQFVQGGAGLLTGSADCSIRALDVETGKVGYTCKNAHTAPISTMKALRDDRMMLSGDDNGTVKLWDLRKPGCVLQWEESIEFISDFAIPADGNMALYTCGDGHLAAIHLRKGTLVAMSDDLESGLLCMAIVKNGAKVAVGDEEGIVSVWKWDQFGDMQTRLVGHPHSVDSMVALDEDTIATGSSDGLIRVCTINPEKLLGVLGEHGEFPIEKLRLSPAGTMVASCSHDNSIKFWSTPKDDGTEVEEDGKEEEGGNMVDGGADKGDDDSSSGEEEMEVDSKSIPAPKTFWSGFQ